jgi:hypothetical protein
MPIVFNPQAFQSPGFQQAAADRAPDALELMLARAKLDGWKEARENDKRRLALVEQDQAMQVEDRAATMEAAGASVDYKQGQAPRDERRRGLRVGGNPNDPLGLTQGASVGLTQSDQQDETAQVERILGNMKDPRAKQAFLADVTMERKARSVAQGLTSIRDRLQDRLVGIMNDEDAAAFAPDYQRLVDELEQITEDMDPKIAAAIIDDVGRREAGYSKEVRETALWKKQQRAVVDMVAQRKGMYPPNHPMQGKLDALGLSATLGEVEPKDAMDLLAADDVGRIPVDLPGFGKVWMTEDQAIDYQDKQADNIRAKTRDQYRTKHEEEMREFRGREVALKEQGAKAGKGGPTVSRGIRAPTFNERMDMVDTLMDERDLEFDAAWEESGNMIREHIRSSLSELGAGAQGGGVPPTAPKGDAIIEGLSAEMRAKYDAMTPEKQAEVRKQLGGG